jgi:hypothetical protein
MPQHPFRLIPFSKDKESSADIQISGTIRRDPDMLHIDYEVTDSFYEIQWPHPSAKPLRKNDLWQHTCFEVFIAPWGVQGYWEFNIAPSCDWNCYRFTDYREGQKPEFNTQAIDCALQETNSTHKLLRVGLPLPKELQQPTWSVGISAVIQDKYQDLHYYALTHCGKEPDFHMRNSFMLTLARD